MTVEGIGCSKPKPGTPEAKAARAEGMKWLRVGVELGSREAHRHLRYLQTHKDWLGGDPTLDCETEWVHPDNRITPPGCQKWISWSDQKRIDGPVESSARSHSPLSPAATVQRHDGKKQVGGIPDKSKSEEFLFAHQPHV